jgi:UDP-glucose 4-epimerase
MRVLVTGGAGFIGANLCAVALSGGCDVVVLDDLSTGRLANIEGFSVELTVGSILDDESLDRACSGVEAIVHLAALPSVPRSVADPVTSHMVNATGTLHVLEAARRHGIPHVIVASSSSVYGANPVLPKHEATWTRPLSPYAASKLAAEAYAHAYAASYGLRTLIFRFFNVYGPGQTAGHAYAAVIPRFLEMAMAGRPLEIFGDGNQIRDFTYVDSVSRVLLDAVRRQVTHTGPVNLAFGTQTTINELVTTLEVVLERPVTRTQVAERPGDVRTSTADGTTMFSLFPDAAGVPLREGLARTAAWFSQSRHDMEPSAVGGG